MESWNAMTELASSDQSHQPRWQMHKSDFPVVPNLISRLPLACHPPSSSRVSRTEQHYAGVRGPCAVSEASVGGIGTWASPLGLDYGAQGSIRF